MTLVSLDESLDWSDFDIPGGSMPVRLATLRVEPNTRGRVVLVEFPTGWERPHECWYECGEELILLDGALEMSSQIYRPGDWAFVPALSARTTTKTPGGALAFARFDGPARVRQGPAPGPEGALRGRLEPTDKTLPSPLGSGRAWLLRIAEPSSWYCDAPDAGRPSPMDTDILSIAAREWAFVAEGKPFPRLEGPCFCRTFSAGGAT